MTDQKNPVIDQLNKKYGINLYPVSTWERPNYEVISTGSLSLDIALGTGGYVRGKVYEIYGPESSGKSTLAIHAIVNVQKTGKFALLIDSEGSFDQIYATALGVDMSMLSVVQPDTGEQAFSIAKGVSKTDLFGIIIFDSIAFLVPQAVFESDGESNPLGAHSRMISSNLPSLALALRDSPLIVLIVNQLRNKIGGYGNPETTTGGWALKYLAHVKIDLRRRELVKAEEGVTGNAVRAKVVKNKLAPPFGECEFVINYGQGIDILKDIFEAGKHAGLFVRSGSWYSYKDEKLGQGEKSVVEWLSLMDESEFLNIQSEISKALK